MEVAFYSASQVTKGSDTRRPTKCLCIHQEPSLPSMCNVYVCSMMNQENVATPLDRSALGYHGLAFRAWHRQRAQAPTLNPQQHNKLFIFKPLQTRDSGLLPISMRAENSVISRVLVLLKLFKRIHSAPFLAPSICYLIQTSPRLR